MKVPFLDLEAAYDELRHELDDAYFRVMSSGRYLLGRELDAFEEEFAAYSGAKHCVGVASGSDALYLSLRAKEIGPGDCVIVPTNTYVATWLAVSRVGAALVPVEPNPETYTLELAAVESALCPDVAALMPVHLYGQPAKIDELTRLADRSGLVVLPDAAQAHGARYMSKPLGNFGDAVSWSFYPSKNLGGFGDGGAVTTDSASVADELRSLRNYGSRIRDVVDVEGVNSRLSELQAAFLRVKLQHLDGWNARRAERAERYLTELEDLELGLPLVAPNAESCWHQFVVRCQHRDEVMAGLAQGGVATLVHYPVPPYAQGAFAHLGILEGQFPVADRLHREVLSLPIGPHMTDAQQNVVIDLLRSSVPTRSS